MFLILAIPLWLLLFYVDITATIKRLHDLGRPGSDIFLSIVPFVSWSLSWQLWFKSANGEIDREASRDYWIKEYDKRYKRYHPRDDFERRL